MLLFFLANPRSVVWRMRYTSPKGQLTYNLRDLRYDLRCGYVKVVRRKPRKAEPVKKVPTKKVPTKKVPTKKVPVVKENNVVEKEVGQAGQKPALGSTLLVLDFLTSL